MIGLPYIQYSLNFKNYLHLQYVKLFYKKQGLGKHDIISVMCWKRITKNIQADFQNVSASTKFVCSSTTIYKLSGYTNLLNNASTINQMSYDFITPLKIHIDDVLK